MRVCFYASVDDPALFHLVEFYRQDITALQELGHQVELARRPSDLRGNWDLAWVWWQTSGAPAILAARALRRPSVLVSALSHRDTSPAGMARKSAHAKLAASAALRLADLVLATSEDTRAGLSRYRLKTLRTAPLGVDTELYRPGETLPKDPYVLTISHLTSENVKRKRILDVVRTAALVPGVRFKLAGEALDGAAAVRAEIDALGIGDRFELLGRVSAERKRRLLADAPVYLQPTLYEAFGLAMGEAMASGAVVVSNRVGNVPALVGESGVLLPPLSPPEAIAAALRDLLGRDDLPELGASARRRVERYFSREHRLERVASALAEVT